MFLALTLRELRAACGEFLKQNPGEHYITESGKLAEAGAASGSVRELAVVPVVQHNPLYTRTDSGPSSTPTVNQTPIGTPRHLFSSGVVSESPITDVSSRVKGNGVDPMRDSLESLSQLEKMLEDQHQQLVAKVISILSAPPLSPLTLSSLICLLSLSFCPSVSHTL